jgi:hypothetical protein
MSNKKNAPEQQPEPEAEVPIQPEPQLSPATLAEMKAGRQHAAANAEAVEKALQQRAEEAASKK